MFRFLFLASALIPAILATEGLQTCNRGPSVRPDSVNVIGCDQTPCVIILGESARMEMVFTAPTTIQDLRPSATAFMGILPVPYPLPPEIQRGCDHLANATCPIPAGTTVKYNFELPVSEDYPPTPNLPVEITLQDGTTGFQCIRVTIRATRG
ncbi:NPC intracellular cholesterol transporter 2-like [Phlebotomus argentipes]|uniref:NPC intracellular cholesterol transporter 2-like n=1 Tax=Phlebotomus argentipes TaxID=94469 RepID=UPI00289341D0|nr:NPC intracellular cholesterol transporter 2-like [Phlebotomus argentipes]